jgi:transposase
MYVLVEGVRWRSLPNDFPAWASVYGYFRKWRDNGVLAALRQTLYALERQRQERHESPSAGCIDSQSVIRTEQRYARF